ncbi:MAG: pectinesterase family protein [Lachnospiraceae bacterium]|nr:pectinesterase family protein [Lachnospiraceae bacterium]
MLEFYVASVLSSEKNNYSTVQSAINAVPADNSEPVLIHIAKGEYKEQLVIQKPFITLEGESETETILTYDLGAYEILEDGIKRGTFRTASVFIDTHDFTARNLTFANTAGLGKLVGQALALYVEGDRITFDHCQMLGSQDTLFTGPLPLTAYEPGGFRGPKEFAPRINGRQYYKNCFIRGDVDFIFGSATAYFEQCEIFCQKTDDEPAAFTIEYQKTYSYITAASTAEGQEYGYVFDHCHLTGNCPKASCYLGRPWRNFAKVVYLHCEMEEHIHPAGWHDWGKKAAHDTIFFAEYQSTGAGGDSKKRASFSKQLSEKEAHSFTKEKVLGNDF